MVQAPVRLLFAFRLRISLGVMVAVAISTVVFAATPFLVRGIAVDRGVDVSRVGTISTAQLSGFVLASWGAGRYLRPRRRMMVVSVLVGVASNLASALAPTFEVLVATRVASGISLGLIAWIAWAEAFGDDARVGDIAVIGPIVGTLSSPVLAMVIDRAGPDQLFVLLAVLNALPLLFVRGTRLQAVMRPRHQRHRPTRAAAAILACLGLATFGGSAMFVYASVIGRDVVGLGSLAVALAFSANALAGVPSAKYRGRRPLPGLWMVVTALAACALGTLDHPVVFWIAMPLWGFAFWMCIPGAFALLAERSRFPAERAGDAQAIMAAGRVVGPLLGGAAYALSPAALGVVAGGIMATAGIALVYVEWRMHPEVLGALLPTPS